MSRKEIIGVISDLVLAVLFGVGPLPVLAKWGGWFLCWIGFVYIMQAVIRPIKRLSRKTRLASIFTLAVLFLLVFRGQAISERHEEKAAALEGDLELKQPLFGKKGFFVPIMEIGDSGTWFTWLLNSHVVEQMRPAYDSGFKIEGSETGLVVSTSVRDKDGSLLLEVIRNHWKIYPAFCSDKNYTSDSLEVKDNRGHVVFQLSILPDKIRVQGEWYDDIGRGVQVIKSADPKMPGAFFAFEDRRKGIISEQLIQPMFVYPSKDHWGEIVR